MHIRVTRTVLGLVAERSSIEICSTQSARYPRNSQTFTNVGSSMARERRRIDNAVPKLDQRACWKREK